MIANDNLGNLGRLGNQMFQYASLRGIASKHGYEYCLPPRSVFGVYDSNVKNSDVTIFECFKIPKNIPIHITNYQRLMESTFSVDENIWENCPDNISLFGYFQSEKYFNHIENEIREAFTFIDDIKYPCDEFFNSKFANSKVISLHIRRGDYCNLPHHPIQEIDYYSKSLEYFDNQLPVIVFSDDIGWCKDQNMFKDDRFLMSDNNNSAVDLYLQSRCNYHIIANSSFSWWGSWLAKSETTFAPKKWFDGPHQDKNTKDLYLDDWTVI